MTDNNKISELLRKYDEGITSGHEEKLLRESFCTMSIGETPKEWRVYKAMFAYVDGQQTPTALPHSVKRLRIWLGTIAAAACLTALLIVHSTGYTTSKSYAVINGVRTDNPDIIHHEAIQALRAISLDEDDCFEALQSIKLNDERHED